MSTAIIADAASVADGKLFVHGGGWDMIWSQTFPVTHPSLSVAFVIEFKWSESNVDRSMSVTLHDEDDADMGTGVVGVMNIGHPPHATHGAPILAPIALTFPGLRFERPGRYYFKLAVDNQELARVGFGVRKPMTLPTSSPTG